MFSNLNITEWVVVLTAATLAVGLIGGHIAWMFKVERHLLIITHAFDDKNKDNIVSRQNRLSDDVRKVKGDINKLREEVLDLSSLMTVISSEPELLAEAVSILKSLTVLAKRNIARKTKEHTTPTKEA